MNPLLIGPIVSLIDKGIDKWFPDAGEAARAKMDVARLIQDGELKELEVRMSAILAESQSTDKWTSRARPAFMYVFYVLIVVLTMLAPLAGIWRPEAMELYFIYVTKGFAAIPEPFWWTFSVGYLGYAGLRSREKEKGVAK